MPNMHPTAPQTAPQTTFTRMRDSTQADWQVIGGEFRQFAKGLPDRVLTHLRLLEGDFGGFPVDRATHSLQTATRALRDAFKDHPFYATTEEFVALYDDPSFDAHMPTLPLAEFEPIVRRVMAQPRNSI